MKAFSRAVRPWLACGAALVPAAVIAQEMPQAVAAAGPQDIVVTARRVSENLQTVPVSVTAVTAGDIAAMAARDVMDLEGSAPNVQITRDTTYPSTATFTIRGETTLDPARYSEPAVVVALDQVFQPSINGALIDTFDMAQVEILRGPQGTLFGRNTIGGVVNIARKRPKLNRFGYEGSLMAGSYGRFDAKMAGNIPIIDDMLAARIVFTRLTGGGYARNRYYDVDPSVGKHRLGLDTATGRIALLFEPASNLSVYANYVLLSGNDDAGGVWNFSRPDDPICAGGGGVTQSCGPQSNREVYDNRPNINNLKTHWLSLQAEWSHDWGTITAIGSYIRERQRQTLNFDGTELAYYDTLKIEHARTKTLEVRYSGEPLDGVALQVGGYFMRENNDYFQSSNLFFSAADFTQGAAFHSRSNAAFAQVDWTVVPDVRVTGGIRYTSDLKAVDSFYPLAVGPDFNPAPIVTTGGLRKTFKNRPGGLAPTGRQRPMSSSTPPTRAAIAQVASTGGRAR